MDSVALIGAFGPGWFPRHIDAGQRVLPAEVPDRSGRFKPAWLVRKFPEHRIHENHDVPVRRDARNQRLETLQLSRVSNTGHRQGTKALVTGPKIGPRTYLRKCNSSTARSCGREKRNIRATDWPRQGRRSY